MTEAIGERLISEWSSHLTVGLRLRRQGNGYLRSRIRKFAEIARKTPMVIITDLDQVSCAAELRRQWLGRLAQPPGLLLRVAVHEVEAWLLADDDAMRKLLGTRASKGLPNRPDEIHRPKEFLLRLASHTPRVVRESICRDKSETPHQGLSYNASLCRVVADLWDPARAALRSESLRRARDRIKDLAFM